jgi:hypothetical protein
MVKNIPYNNNGVITMISDEELAQIIESANVWSLESHLAEISQQHDDIFNKILSDYNYTSFAELAIWSQEPDNEYYEEANAIKEWYKNSWFEIKEYGDAVNEKTAKNIEQIITSFKLK